MSLQQVMDPRWRPRTSQPSAIVDLAFHLNGNSSWAPVWASWQKLDITLGGDPYHRLLVDRHTQSPHQIN